MAQAIARAWRGIVAALCITICSATAALPQGAGSHAGEPPAAEAVKTGLEVFLSHPPSVVVGKRVGLITNPTGVDRSLRSTIDLLATRTDLRLVALFGPEHGVRGEAASWLANSTDARTRLPVYSLFGKTLSPTPAMLKNVDVLVFDIQDAGVRFYTYISTLALAMKAAAGRGIPFVVLDRPNPIGGEAVAGPVLDLRWKSFMGMYPLPIVHGMTIGELAQMFNAEYGINAALTVVPMDGWHRSMWFDETALPWVISSPGIPHFLTAVLYPAMGPIGDTNLSVGTLTTKPFEFVGQTFVQPWRLREGLEARHIPGVAFREAYWRGEPWTDVGGPTYAGVELRVVDRNAYRPVDLTLQILDVFRRYYPTGFKWGRAYSGSYVFDWDMGTDQVRRQLVAGKSPAEIEKSWEPDLQRFLTVRAKYLLYH
jgi:uncharacterized protein YbbC (DUF1343 family)